MGENYTTALKAEEKRVVRCFYSYPSEQRANHAASFRLGSRQRSATGEFFYIHPDLAGICFPRRRAAAEAALRRAS